MPNNLAAENARIIVLPTGQRLSPGSTSTYEGHTIHFAPSGRFLIVDNEEVTQYYSIDLPSIRSGSGSPTSAWAIELPNGEHLLFASDKIVDEYDIQSAPGNPAVIIDMSHTISLGTPTTAITVPLGGGIVPDVDPSVVTTLADGQAVTFTDTWRVTKLSDGRIISVAASKLTTRLSDGTVVTITNPTLPNSTGVVKNFDGAGNYARMLGLCAKFALTLSLVLPHIF
jgi:hypothetical protein